MTKRTKILCILDGFGARSELKNNCQANAFMPNLQKMFDNYPSFSLKADGEDVGQENCLVGNSEVGHLNIGGLKLVPQISYQITHSAKNNFNLDKNVAPDQNLDPKQLLQNIFNNQKHKQITKNDSDTVHLVGLFSSGKIHSDIRHLISAIQSSFIAGAKKVVLHLITDGRDSDKQSFLKVWEKFQLDHKDTFETFKGKIFIGSVSGRFYAMDRDNNRERTLQAAVCMIGHGDFSYNNKTGDTKKIRYYNDLEQYFNIELAKIGSEVKYGLPSVENYKDPLLTENINNFIKSQYDKGNYDETILPSFFRSNAFEEPFNNIKQGDTIWFLNYRSDRFKQITTELVKINKDLSCGWHIIANNDYGIDSIKPYTSIQAEYDFFNPTYYTIFQSKKVENGVAQKISESGKTQLHIAETEKYAHVTYFFNGGKHEMHENEEWKLIPSNKVHSHAEKPEMKAKEITDYIIENGIGKFDYIVVNYANPDMVGHTGNFEAGIESMEFLDTQLGRFLDFIEKDEIDLIITADHGNIEFVGEHLENENDKTSKVLTDTEHNSNPAPFIFITKNYGEKIKSIKKAILNNVQNEIVQLGADEIEIVENLETYLKINKTTYHLNKNKNCFIINTTNKPCLKLFFSGIFYFSL